MADTRSAVPAGGYGGRGAGVTPPQARLLERASEAVEAARLAASGSDGRTAANRAYYAMFFAAWALVAGTPEVGRRHQAVHAAFGERFARTRRLDPRLHRWLLDAFDLRLLADYDPLTEVEPEITGETVDQAAEFVRMATTLLRQR